MIPTLVLFKCVHIVPINTLSSMLQLIITFRATYLGPKIYPQIATTSHSAMTTWIIDNVIGTQAYILRVFTLTCRCSIWAARAMVQADDAPYLLVKKTLAVT